MTDEKLTATFVRVFGATGSIAEGVRAVRLALEAHAEERLDRRHRRPAANIDPGVVLALVAEDQGLQPAAIVAGRDPRGVEARYVAVATLRAKGWSYPGIARAVGLGSHIGARHADIRVEERPELQAARDRVLARLAGVRQGVAA